jgi:uncharacterized membrane protein YdbT with pleckstrin-like domain
MSYGESLLAKGEHIIYRGRQHWLAPLSDSLRPIVLVLLGLLAFFLSFPLGGIGVILLILAAVLLVVGIVWIAIVYLTWRAQEYLITNRRVLKVEGLLDKKTADSALDKINDAVLSQGLLARILKYGDLEIMTAAEIAVDRYEMLARAVDFKKAMLDAKNQLEYGDRPGTAPAAPPAGSEIEAKLDQLTDLLRRGKITQADYDRKKADLLDKM